LKHSDKTAYFATANLEKVLGVTEFTVVRFADIFGHKGYRVHTLKKLQNRNKSKLNTTTSC